MEKASGECNGENVPTSSHWVFVTSRSSIITLEHHIPSLWVILLWLGFVDKEVRRKFVKFDIMGKTWISWQLRRIIRDDLWYYTTEFDCIKLISFWWNEAKIWFVNIIELHTKIKNVHLNILHTKQTSMLKFQLL